MSLTSIATRILFSRGDKKRDAGLTTPGDVIRYDNLPYGPHGKWNLLDVYRPKACREKLPVIISVHGGGWVYGTKEVYQFYCMSLSRRGFAVINFNYRLAPASRYPAQMEDINRVVCWMTEHAREFGFDTENVFMVGDSAGAHMLALYCCICTNPDYGARYDFRPPEDFVPRAVALNCGIYDIVRSLAGENRGKRMRDLLGKNCSAEGMEFINPVRYITEDFPPAYVMTATGDFLKDQPAYLLEIFEKKHITCEYRIYGSEENRLPHVFHCNMRSEDAKICNDEECDFFCRMKTS